VIRVSMPDTGTRAAINRTRAILLAVGILTVFLAMVALYYVVKYIVIKPLAHLRDVSDRVAKGDLAQRAEIQTNDEFEDLAASFNKMLVHLIETQGELREANAELDGKVDELAHLNMQLHEMNRLKGEFLANMSHELRTPLNSIIGFSEVLQSLDALNDKQKRYAVNIQKSGRMLLDMINDILDLAKMEAGKMEVRLSEFRIDAVIAAQCDMVRSLADEKNIDVSCEIENDLPLLYQDQAKVQQILTNLLSNAIKFTPEGGRIMVGARGDSRGRIEFWVADTGVGIPEAEKDVIFEKFRQGMAVLGRDNLTREYSGTGLGLSIVKELCKLLGGEISVESELGKGSIFRVIIPWMRTDTPAATARLNARLDDLARPRRIEDLRGEPAEVAATRG
jgi:two-component system, NarL family, sensor histidine kinase BarA